MFQGDDMCVGVDIGSKVLVVPGAISIVNVEETLGCGWRRLLVGIGGIGDRNDKAFCSSNDKEQFHTWLLNTGCVCLCKFAQMWGGFIQTITMGMGLMRTVGFHDIRPLNAQYVGWPTITNGSRSWDRWTKGTGLMVCVKLCIESCIPIGPIG